MARDRERARRRRAERRAAGGRDDAVESPLGEGTGAPDPLAHSSAEVDEALLAEAGAEHPGAEHYERAPDEVEGDAVSARDRERARSGPPAERRQRARFIAFLGHCIDELRRVQWPNRRQTGQATAVVLGFVVLAGGYLGLLDALWQPLIEAIL